MKTFLILVFVGAQNPYPKMTYTEFATAKECAIAKDKVQGRVAAFRAFCIRKG